jgi:hypothetical protein
MQMLCQRASKGAADRPRVTQVAVNEGFLKFAGRSEPRGSAVASMQALLSHAFIAAALRFAAGSSSGTG